MNNNLIENNKNILNSNNLNLEKEFSGGVYITEGEYVYNKK